MSEPVRQKPRAAPAGWAFVFSCLVVLVLSAVVWGSSLVSFWHWWSGFGGGTVCGPRIGVECPEGTGLGLAAMWIAIFSWLGMLIYLTGRNKGPFMITVIPALFGVGLGGRFLWASVFHTEGTNRIPPAVLGLGLLAGLGFWYGRRVLFAERSADTLFWALRAENRLPVRPVGQAEKRQWAALVGANAAGLAVGISAGVALL